MTDTLRIVYKMQVIREFIDYSQVREMERSAFKLVLKIHKINGKLILLHQK